MEVQTAKDIKITRLTALVYGDSGVGKTYSLRTLPKPVFVFCTDPDGMTTLRGTEGVDFVYFGDQKASEVEQAIEEFEKTLLPNYKSVAFDSITTLSTIIMNYCIKLTGRDPEDMFPTKSHGGTKEKGVLLGPNQQDYGNEMTLLSRLISHVMKWPLNIVFTAHVELHKDQLSGRILGQPLVTGKLRARLPIQFSETYLAFRNGSKYQFRTKPDAIYVAKSRLAQEGKLDELEEPDFTKLLAKAGVCG